MTKEMEAFLPELEALLRKHDATIVRSANSTHDLVVSIPSPDADHGFDDLHLEEELNADDIKFKRFKRG